MTIKVTETAPGHINVTCEESGLPITRATMLGMFCAATPCKCEEASNNMMTDMGMTSLGDLLAEALKVQGKDV